MEISVIVPMYNEEENVNRTIATLENILQSYDHELLIIDDGSVDKTYEIANNYHVIRIISRFLNIRSILGVDVL